MSDINLQQGLLTKNGKGLIINEWLMHWKLKTFILKWKMHSLKEIISDAYIKYIEKIGYVFGLIPYHEHFNSA